MNTTKRRGRPKKVEIIEEIKQPQADQEEVKVDTEVLELRVAKQFPNPRWVGCDNKGEILKVAISPKYTNKLVGKIIKVAKVQRDLLESYEHLP